MSDYDGVSEFQRGPAPMSFPQGGGGGNSWYGAGADAARLLTALTENVTKLTELVDQDVDNHTLLQARVFQQEAHLKSVAERLDDLSWRTVLMFGWSFGNTLAIFFLAVNS